MVSTISINELEKYADNIYEAIIIMAKRARQINDQQKRFLVQDQDKEYDDGYDEYDEEQIEQIPEVKYKKVPKPTTIALEEFLSGRIRYDYHDTSENEDSAQS